MVAVTLILDGASEPLGAAATSLERARTPVLDALVRAGALSRLRTTPAGLAAGSETGIPVLLGWTPPAPVDRGMVEAAAREIPLDPGHRAWRVDAVDGDRARGDEAAVARAVESLRSLAPGHALWRIGGHRLLVTGAAPPPVAARPDLRLWPTGVVPARVLGPQTAVVAARGAAAGIARLMGATVIVPPGATGFLDTDLEAKAAAACRAIADGRKEVVVHVGAPDEASHLGDPEAKAAALERIDRELVAPVAEGVRARGGTLRVCADHGCDPRTGLHDDAPVPCLVWTAGARARSADRRLTERDVASLPVVEPAPAARSAA